jgi:homoserine kinase
MTHSGTISAFAPASVGNVGVGFDVLGHALDSVGDEVTLTSVPESGIHLRGVSGLVDTLPSDPCRNTALRPLVELRAAYDIDTGVEVQIRKGIPIGSGMGGSAASAVAAVVAADALWNLRLEKRQMLSYALAGESVASGDVHADNVAPSLLGGLVVCEMDPGPHATRIGVPAELVCVLVHPALRIDTREARRLLRDSIPMALHVRQSQSLAGFLAGCQRGDLQQIGRCLRDHVVEPQRKQLIPGYDAVQAAARSHGALGGSISGSGPSVFAWCHVDHAPSVADAMVAAFRDCQVEADAWLSPVAAPGARLL